MKAGRRRVWLTVCALAVVHFAQVATAATPPDFSGKWLIDGVPTALRTVSGGAPPTLNAGTSPAANSPDPIARCLPPGLPRLYLLPHPFLILARPSQTLMVFEFQRLVRRVYAQGTEPADQDPSFLGNATAHWDGDTWIAETRDFKSSGLLDASGLPYGTALHLTERWRLRDARTLENTITVEDSEHYATPWQTRLRFRRQTGTELAEDVCVDRVWPERVRRQEQMERAP